MAAQPLAIVVSSARREVEAALEDEVTDKRSAVTAIIIKVSFERGGREGSLKGRLTRARRRCIERCRL